MANGKKILTRADKSEMRDFSYSSAMELTVTNLFKEKRVIINSHYKFKKGTIKQILYFQIEEYFFNKKPTKIKNINVSRKKFEEYYKNLASIKINNIIPTSIIF